MVGTKTKNIVEKRQVFRISHLFRVAALAVSHFIGEKKAVEGRSRSIIYELRNPDRIEELLWMLGGKTLSAIIPLHLVWNQPLP